MKKTTALFAIAFTAAAALFAQPQLQMNVLPNIGSSVVVHSGDTININPGNAGANQTWNFAGLNELSGTAPSLNTYVAPSGTPSAYAALFPDANYAIAVTGSGSTVYAYYKKEASQYSFLGVKSDDYEQIFINPDVQLKATSFNGTYQDDYTNSTNSGTGFIFYAKGSRNAKYDAYGTLITPGGTYNNAIRLKYASSQTDSVDLGGITNIQQTDINGYDWFVPNQPGVFVSIFFIHSVSTTYIPGFPPQVSDNGVTKYVTYQSDFTVGATERPQALAGVTLGFGGANPVADQLALNITADTDRQDLLLMLTNAEGKVLDIQNLSLNTGENRISVSVAQFPAGTYFATLSDGRSLRTLTWMK